MTNYVSMFLCFLSSLSLEFSVCLALENILEDFFQKSLCHTLPTSLYVQNFLSFAFILAFFICQPQRFLESDRTNYPIN